MPTHYLRSLRILLENIINRMTYIIEIYCLLFRRLESLRSVHWQIWCRDWTEQHIQCYFLVLTGFSYDRRDEGVQFLKTSSILFMRAPLSRPNHLSTLSFWHPEDQDFNTGIQGKHKHSGRISKSIVNSSQNYQMLKLFLHCIHNISKGHPNNITCN